MNSLLRSGQWTLEEVSFATRLIDEFRNGSLQIPDGTSMRGFLAEKLGCVPKRVSKKYENTNYNGRLQYTRDESLSAERCVRVRLELEKLERAFRQSVKKEAQDRKPKAKPEPPRQQQVPQKSEKKCPPASANHAESTVANSASVAQLPAATHMLPQSATRGSNMTVGDAASTLLSGSSISATGAGNEELLNLLAARQRLVQRQSLLLQTQQQPRTTSLTSALASRASERFNRDLLSSLTSRPQHASLLPLPQTASLERLRLLQQLELEQQKQRLLSTTTAALQHRSCFEEQARLMAASKTGKAASAFLPAGLSPGDLLQALREQRDSATNNNDWRTKGSVTACVGARGQAAGSAASKRKKAPSVLLPDPKRPRFY
ncbi:expressed unknown protein [Seminavis robusta]|uniref:Uncharacterized protein n=1 Tax=Seminavis robusta TaxID=568900 RepID=A0A9N8DWA2_9STRA|nr:expressed unknown protein [Seminavis robusta]|eukprot:Sro322_g116980.1 n/a (376) ;mRNA; r:23723-24850